MIYDKTYIFNLTKILPHLYMHQDIMWCLINISVFYILKHKIIYIIFVYSRENKLLGCSSETKGLPSVYRALGFIIAP